MGINNRKRLTKNALKCWYLRWLLAFILLLGIELLTVIISNRLLYGIALTVIRISALSMPVLFGIALIVTPYLKYIGFSYILDNDKLFIYSGIITKKKESLPIKNIQHIELKALPFERIFGLATIRIYTSGSEHTLPSIQLNDAKLLQSLVYRDYRE